MQDSSTVPADSIDAGVLLSVLAQVKAGDFTAVSLWLPYC